MAPRPKCKTLNNKNSWEKTQETIFTTLPITNRFAGKFN